MSDAGSPPDLVTELQVSAHLMQLAPGVYCVHHSPGSIPPDTRTGLPGARLTLPPGPPQPGVSITGFRDDGWLGSLDAAALVRVAEGPAQVLMTIYQAAGVNRPPRLQVTKLVDSVAQAPSAASEPVADSPPDLANMDAEIAAHIQLRGDVLARIGDWVGDPGSQRSIEGFALSPRRTLLAPENIEYQAVLGRGWLSPWVEGGQYCGSRGMALPILGLRVRLRGEAATSHTLRVSGTFTDGAQVGPVGSGDACEAESLAALEAFRIEIIAAADSMAPAPRPGLQRPALPRPVPKAKGRGS